MWSEKLLCCRKKKFCSLVGLARAKLFNNFSNSLTGRSLEKLGSLVQVIVQLLESGGYLVGKCFRPEWLVLLQKVQESTANISTCLPSPQLVLINPSSVDAGTMLAWVELQLSQPSSSRHHKHSRGSTRMSVSPSAQHGALSGNFKVSVSASPPFSCMSLGGNTQPDALRRERWKFPYQNNFPHHNRRRQTSPSLAGAELSGRFASWSWRCHCRCRSPRRPSRPPPTQ